MNKIIIENFRCFHSKQEIPLTPITFLVGENSTGKTSFLAAVKVALDSIKGDVNFNQEPFNLGAYDQIANYRGGRGGRAKEFFIGSTFKITNQQRLLKNKYDFENIKNLDISINTKFSQKGTQPKIVEQKINIGDIFSIAQFYKEQPFKNSIIKSKIDNEEIPIPLDFPSDSAFLPLNTVLYIPKIFVSENAGKQYDKLTFFYELLHDTLAPLNYFAISPIRTKPERTYDPQTETPQPEGAHIPMILAQLSGGEKTGWNNLKEKLIKFGSSAGLFKNLKVQRKGTKESDPFQILVKIFGSETNLIDVGYGVSQALPILVDSLKLQPNQLFLLQQPEVHLHPRAQAELGSFFGMLAKEENKKFIIETHSDYLIDRIRIDVRNKKYGLTSDDVTILYFDWDKTGVKIYPIKIDSQGNILDAPKNYRNFFIKEEENFFGI